MKTCSVLNTGLVTVGLAEVIMTPAARQADRYARGVAKTHGSAIAREVILRRYLLRTISAAALLAGSVRAKADVIVNYNFTPVNWVTNSSPLYPTDGGNLSGTMSYDWTNHTVVSASLTSTASTSGNWSTQTFSSMTADYNGNYIGTTFNYNGTTYSNPTPFAEVTGHAGGQTLFVDFTQGDLVDIFPGQLTGVHTSNTETGGSRVLASTVTVSAPPSGPINGTGAAMDSSNLGSSLSPVFHGGTLIIVPGSTSLASNFSVQAYSGNTIDANGNVTLFSGTLTGAGGLTFADSSGNGSVVTLTNTANAYFGATTITSATLRAGADNVFSGNSAVTLSNASAAALDLAGHTESISGLNGGGSAGGNVLLGAGALYNYGSGGTYSGVISGTGSFNQMHGNETLTGTNTYTGPTTINPLGILLLSGTGSIAASSGLADNGGFDLSATTAGALIASLSGTGSVTLGTQTLTLTNANDTFSGAISGTGGLSVTGGTETLTGTNTYTGITAISPGAAIALSGAGSIAASSGLADSGAFNLSATTAGAAITTLSGTGLVTLGAQTLTLTNANDTFSGAISGTGGLSVTGGNQTLTGTSTYSGGTSVSNATLAINSDAALGAPAGALTINNGVLAALSSFNTARPVTLTGPATVATNGNAVGLTGLVSGNGALSAVGGGSLTLGGINTYSGGTSIVGGTTLKVASDTALGAPSGVLVLGDTGSTGTLQALSSFTSGRNILVNPGGGVIDAHGNVLTLTGAITEVGVLQTTGGPGGEVLDLGSITVNNFVISSGVSTSTGTVNAAANLVVNSDGTFTNSGIVNAASVTVGGQLIDTGTVKATSSVTVASAGFMSENGTLNSPSLTVAGTLRGTGTINAPTTVSGTIAPGNSPGTLTFTAPVTLTPTAITEFDIDGTGTGTGAGNYSRIIVTGAANSFTASGTLLPLMRGITGNATNTYIPPIAQQFQVINAAGGIAPASGFAGLIQPAGLATGTRLDALYAPTTLTLVVTPAAYANLQLTGISETADQKALGATLDGFRPAAGVRMDVAQQSLFYPLYTLPAAVIPTALDQLSPVAYADGLMAVRQGWYLGTSSIGDQLADRRSGMASSTAAAGPHGTTIWVNGIGQFTDVSSPGATNAHTSVGGAIAGIDMPINPATVLGISFGGSSLQTSAGNGATVSGNEVQASVYGGYHSQDLSLFGPYNGQLFVDGQVSYVHADQDVRQYAGFAQAASRGSTPAQGGGGQVNGGVHLMIQQWQLEPTIGLTALSLSSASASETTGGALAEHIGGFSTTSIQSFAGLRIATLFGVPTIPVQTRGIIGWSHEMADTTARAPASFTGFGDTGVFSATTAPVGRDALRLGGGFDVAVAANISLYASYTASLAHDMTAQNLTGGIRVRW